jgi:Ala-tRNA(Pro) deacylase
MAIAQSIEAFLKQHAVTYDLISHPRSGTSMQTAQFAHIPGDQLAKSVLLEDETGYLMAVIPSTRHVDLGTLHHRLQRQLGLAVEREVTELFPDCDPGAIPAIGPAYRVATIIDDALFDEPDVYFESGDHEALVHVSGQVFSSMMAGVPHARFTHHV